MIVYIYNIGVDLYNGFNGLRHRINWTYFAVLDGLAHPLYSFSQMGLVEAWGNGIKRILNAAEEYGLPKPRFQEFDNMFRVELFRNSFPMMEENRDIGEASEKHRRSIGEVSGIEQQIELNDTQQKIIKLLLEDNQLSAIKLADRIGIASRNIESNIKKLKEVGILIRHGSPKNGYWEVTLTY